MGKNIVKEQDVVNFYRDHTDKQTKEEFHIGSKKLYEILQLNNTQKHGKSVSYRIMTIQSAERFISDVGIDAFISYHKDHSATLCIEHFNITKAEYEYVMEKYSIPEHDSKTSYLFTIKNHYGVDNVFQLDSTKEKSAQTKLNKYGNANYVNMEKVAETNLKKYGVKCALHCDSVQRKVIETNLKRYGSAYYFMTDESKVYNKRLMEERFLKESGYTEEYLSLRFYKDATWKFLSENPMTMEELAKRFDTTIGSIHRWLVNMEATHLFKHSYNNQTSDKEQEVFEYVQSIYGGEILTHDKKILRGKEIDILIPEQKIAIEFNGSYWHSSLYKDKKYHQEKSNEMSKLGYRLIHVYEFEWDNKNDIIKSILCNALGKTKNRLYARKCSIEEINTNTYREFCNENHLMGYRQASIRLALRYNNKIVQVMSFSKNRKYEWEIIRECSLLFTCVIGGSNKLFKHFLKVYNPEEVFSYCDYNKFVGTSYENLGMKYIGTTEPDFVWLMSGGIVVNRSPNKNKYYKENARAKIYGSGSKRYLYKNN